MSAIRHHLVSEGDTRPSAMAIDKELPMFLTKMPNRWMRHL